jgi:hypothetical protein
MDFVIPQIDYEIASRARVPRLVVCRVIFRFPGPGYVSCDKTGIHTITIYIRTYPWQSKTAVGLILLEHTG